LGKPVVKDIR